MMRENIREYYTYVTNNAEETQCIGLTPKAGMLWPDEAPAQQRMHTSSNRRSQSSAGEGGEVTM